MGKGRHDVKSSTDREVPPPPDGGWGWVVVLSSFLIHVLADGIVYSFGIFYIEFLDYFKGGKGETAWVGSLVPGVTFTVGPIASILTNRYGCRVVTILGSVIAAGGFILSLFAPNIYYLYFSFGFISGFGFGLIYLPAIVSVTQYFEKRRAFATGLAVCGSGLGTFIFAPFSEWLVETYTWKGAILIQAGLLLNCVICGAVFRPLTITKHHNGTNDKNETEALIGQKGGSQLEKGGGERVSAVELSEENERPYSGKKTLPALFIKQNGFLGATDSIAGIAQSDGALHMFKTNGHMSEPTSPTTSVIPPDKIHRQWSGGSQFRPLYRKDIFYSGSLLNIPDYRSHPDLYISSIQSIPNSDESGAEKGCLKCLSPDAQHVCRQMMDFSLLKHPVFLLFAISNFCTSIGFNMPYIYLPDRALEAGISRTNAAMLVSVIGITNTCGRVLFGWLADRPWVNRIMLYNTALTICGLGTLLSPFCYNYALLVVYAGVFGLFIGVYVSLTSVVLVDLLGLDKLTNSFGLLLLFQGMATLIGPPIAGWLFDGTGSYDVSFHVAGAMIALSGLMLFFIPLLSRCMKVEKPTSTVTNIEIELDCENIIKSSEGKDE